MIDIHFWMCYSMFTCVLDVLMLKCLSYFPLLTHQLHLIIPWIKSALNHIWFAFTSGLSVACVSCDVATGSCTPAISHSGMWTFFYLLWQNIILFKKFTSVMKGILPDSRAEANFDARLNIISQTLTLHDKVEKALIQIWLNF